MPTRLKRQHKACLGRHIVQPKQKRLLKDTSLPTNHGRAYTKDLYVMDGQNFTPEYCLLIEKLLPQINLCRHRQFNGGTNFSHCAAYSKMFNPCILPKRYARVALSLEVVSLLIIIHTLEDLQAACLRTLRWGALCAPVLFLS